MKYPRTPHLPWSPGATSDDVWFDGGFVGKHVVMTEKLDGECTGMNRERCHARSLDSNDHPSRHWVKKLHASICFDIPEGWKIFGENLFAFHSVLYTELPSYFFVFGIYDENNLCIPWKDTVEFSSLLGLQTVPVLYEGVWNEKVIKERWTGKGTFPTFATKEEHPKSLDDFYPTTAEGYVVRCADAYPYERFVEFVAKFVRENHVQTSSNWMTKSVFPNRLKE